MRPARFTPLAAVSGSNPVKDYWGWQFDAESQTPIHGIFGKWLVYATAGSKSSREGTSSGA